MTRRLTEIQKEDILKSFESGTAIDALSKKYTCTNSTIIRNLKKTLGESKFKELLNKSKSLQKIPKTNRNQINQNQINNLQKTNKDNEISKKDSSNPEGLNKNISASHFDLIDSFYEIPPLEYDLENSSRKELSSVPISKIDFPKVVYMIVDKKIELEIKLLKDFPEWEFLPNDDLNRKTIEIFFDLNLAKRSCKKEQKVLKVPNTDVFRIAAPVLMAKGISRIVCPENLIAL